MGRAKAPARIRPSAGSVASLGLRHVRAATLVRFFHQSALLHLGPAHLGLVLEALWLLVLLGLAWALIHPDTPRYRLIPPTGTSSVLSARTDVRGLILPQGKVPGRNLAGMYHDAENATTKISYFSVSMDLSTDDPL